MSETTEALTVETEQGAQSSLQALAYQDERSTTIKGRAEILLEVVMEHGGLPSSMNSLVGSFVRRGMKDKSEEELREFFSTLSDEIIPWVVNGDSA